MKGRHLWNQRSPSVVGAAIACFEGAIALDPEFAAAFAGLADCYRFFACTAGCLQHRRSRARSRR